MSDERDRDRSARTDRRGAGEQSADPAAEAVAERLSAYLDGELSEPERRAIEAELAVSSTLRAELVRLGLVDDMLRWYAAAEVLSEWSETLTSADADEMDDAGDRAGDETVGEGAVPPRRVGGWGGGARWGGPQAREPSRFRPPPQAGSRLTPRPTFGRGRKRIAAVGVALAAVAVAVLWLMSEDASDRPSSAGADVAEPGGRGRVAIDGPVGLRGGPGRDPQLAQRPAEPPSGAVSASAEGMPSLAAGSGAASVTADASAESDASATAGEARDAVSTRLPRVLLAQAPPAQAREAEAPETTGFSVATERVRRIDQTARSTAAAMHLIEEALETGAIPPETEERARAEYLTRLQQLVADLVELDHCNAAARRINQAGAAGLLPAIEDPRLAELHDAVRACRDEAAAAAPRWDARAYRAERDEGGRLLAEALEMPLDSAERAQRLDESLAHQLRAIALLASARDEDSFGRRRRGVTRDMVVLGQSAALAMLELDLRFLAQVQLEDALDRTASLSPEETAPLRELVALLAEENESFVAGDDVSGVLDLLRTRLPIAREGEGDEEQSAPVDASAAAPGEDALQPSEASDPSEASGPSEAEGPVRSVVITVTSEPPRARVYVDGEYVGRTPLSHSLVSASPSVTLTVRKSGYESERVPVEMIGEEGEVDIVLELRPAGPFLLRPQDGPPYPSDFQGRER